MDHNSLINKKTYDICKHAEDCNDYFICDKVIAPAISLLNKKGYTTYASCSGHYKIEFYEWFDEDIKNLEEFKNNPRIIIKKIKEKTFDFWSEIDKTMTYILFDKQYEFKTLPKGFKIDNSNGKTSIESETNFYDESGRKKKNIVEKEIEEKCKILKDWIEKLPEKKGDKYE